MIFSTTDFLKTDYDSNLCKICRTPLNIRYFHAVAFKDNGTLLRTANLQMYKCYGSNWVTLLLRLPTGIHACFTGARKVQICHTSIISSLGANQSS